MNRVRAALGTVLRSVTPFGRAVAALMALTWLFGALLDWRELLLVASVCLALLVLAALTMIGRLDLGSDLTVAPARVVVGERAAGSLTMRNLAKRKSRAVRVELPVGRSSAIFQVPRLPAEETMDELFVVPTARRAIIPVGPVTTVLGDPLGLVRRVHTWSDRYEIFVHPRTVVLETTAEGLVRDLEGQTTNHLTNSDIAFHTLRDYVPGDDRRHVHWKTSAKIGKLMVRQYVDTRRSHLCVLLSTAWEDYADEEEFELAVSAAASICLQAMRDEQTLTVAFGNQQVVVLSPRALLDQFSGLELDVTATGENGGGIDACFAAARRFAAEASVTAIAIGSVPTVAALKRASARVSVDTRILAVACEPGIKSSYRLIGSTGVIRLGALNELRRSLVSVVSQ